MDRQDLESFFERVYVINLDRRPERMERFNGQLPAGWPFRGPERFAAIDGQRIQTPAWWTEGAPAWGCYRSHVRLLEDCLNQKVQSVLFLEDDAVFVPDFSTRVATFLQQVPDDWDMIYLGGQHLGGGTNRPKKVAPLVFQPHNVNRTHAYAVRGELFMKVLYGHLHSWSSWERKHHIDHHLGRLHEQHKHKIYCPAEWLVGQAAGQSDICGRIADERKWPSAEAVSQLPVADGRFIAVVGLHSSGSSALAGMLYHLGVHMGNKLAGYYGNDPSRSCGFEAVGLARICENAIPFPSVKFCQSREQIASQLRNWINQRRREAKNRKTVCGGKYPMLCRLGPHLQDAVGDHLWVVHIQRPLDDSIASLIRRCPRREPSELASHQRWLWQGKQEFAASIPPERWLTVEYYELLNRPKQVIERLIGYLGLDVNQEQIEAAVQSIDRGRCHFQLVS